MKKKKSGGGGANWMDTYGDMVTLLLCFFVLLYSMSTITEEKWIALVRSFNPNAVAAIKETPGGEGPNADENDPPTTTANMTQAEVDQQMNDLYEQIKEFVDSQGAQTDIAVTKGPGYVFIAFNQAVFFDGDSWTLREESHPILEKVCEMLSSVSGAIDEVQVLGHTAQERPDRPNNPPADRSIASNRANAVTLFIQENSTVDPGRLVSVGYGQWRPADTNATREGQAANRRVEMIISGKDLESTIGDSINEYYTIRGSDPPEDVAADSDSAADSGDSGE